MPSQCVHCSKIYDDGAEEILKGCRSCGSRFFFYLTKDKLEKIKQEKGAEIDLTKEEKNQIEKDVRDIVGIKEEDESPIILDFEAVKIIKPGKYLIDVAKLFKGERPLVYKLEDGKYIVDLSTDNKSIK